MLQVHAFVAVLTLFISIFGGHFTSGSAAAEDCEEWVGKIVSVQGRVQARRAGQAQWLSVKLNDTFCPGDMIRLQERCRAAIVLSNETILRLDQKTTIVFSGSKKEPARWIDLLKGAVHFFSRTPQRLKVVTPFVNAAVTGTEFYVRVTSDQTFLSIFEGQVAAANDAGSLTLSSGQSAIAPAGQAPALRMVVRPRDAVQWALYYPPVIDYRAAAYQAGPAAPIFQKVLDRFRKGNLPGAFAALESVPGNLRDRHYFTLRAGLLLSVGRVAEARSDIEHALNLDPGDGTATALQSIIAVVQNEKDQALSLAHRAAGLEPRSPVPRVALSYAYQAAFEIEKALDSAREAVELDPENALAWARVAELWLSAGNLDRALDSAQAAVARDPDLARTQTVLGFAYLTQIKVSQAQSAFDRAIELDPADPLPRLGAGLATIRRGDLAQGRREIEIAMSLDPNNALIRSYLGKAYYEEKRDKLAEAQFDIAKVLDPRDPTAWFYDAIRKQTINRPVEALQDLQKSIELNDNRAVYRSRLLLDEDLAARSASLGRIYNDLGFEQLALVEGWKSLNTDPSNYSAHRFLSDSYAALPRHEIARVSELLQSQLLQPLNLTPVQPRLAESNQFILEGAGPAALSFNEFNPLFLRDRLALQASGVVGSNETYGDELVQSGVQERFSYSLGQFYYETDGFRDNNDLKNYIYNVFMQGNVAPGTSVQAEYRHTKIEQGQLDLMFDPDISPAFRRERDADAFRLGFHHVFSPRSDIVASFIYQDIDLDQNKITGGKVKTSTDFEERRYGYIAELQHLLQLGKINITSGIGHIDQDFKETTLIALIIPGFVQNSTPVVEDADFRRTNMYMYSQIALGNALSMTVGLSADFLERGKQLDCNQINPKMGLTWHPARETTLRLAAFRELGSRLHFNQTIEPTQIAGFNQFFDDINGTDAWRYGAAVDHKFFSSLFGGIEYSERDLDVPQLGGAEEKAPFFDWEEQFGRAYLYWTPDPRLALSAEYQYERFDRRDNPLGRGIVDVRTHRVPLGFNFFLPSGIAVPPEGDLFLPVGRFH